MTRKEKIIKLLENCPEEMLIDMTWYAGRSYFDRYRLWSDGEVEGYSEKQSQEIAEHVFEKYESVNDLHNEMMGTK